MGGGGGVCACGVGGWGELASATTGIVGALPHPTEPAFAFADTACCADVMFALTNKLGRLRARGADVKSQSD